MQEQIATSFQNLEDELVTAIKEGTEGAEPAPSLSLAKPISTGLVRQNTYAAGLSGTEKSVMSDTKSNTWRRTGDLARQY